jgi:hypothetical protein
LFLARARVAWFAVAGFHHINMFDREVTGKVVVERRLAVCSESWE